MEAERKAPSAPTRGIQTTATPFEAEEGECQIRRQDQTIRFETRFVELFWGWIGRECYTLENY